MSQAGIINVIDNNPTIPIYFEGDTGFAVALFNVIKLVGSGGITTSASGNTVTIDGSGIVSSGIETINGDSGSITGNAVTIFANSAINNCGATVKFVNSGTTSTLNLTDGLSNVFLGSNAGNALVSGANNSSQGRFSLANLTTGDSNCALGSTSLVELRSGVNNCAVGVIALQNLFSGNDCIGIGHAAGVNYTGAESNNICIGSAVGGTTGESNVTRIGVDTQVCIIAGIAGVTTSNTNMVTIDTATGQLGSIAVPVGVNTPPFGQTQNLGIAYSAGTFSVQGSQAPLSGSNVGYVTVPSTTNGEYLTLPVTADQTFVDATGSSTIDNNSFGTTADLWPDDMPFYIYAAADTTDANVVFLISRIPHMKTTPAAGLIGKTGSALATTQPSMFALGNPTVANYATRPCVCIGSFRMTKSSTTDWTVSALSSSDGIGCFMEDKLFTMPAGVMGNAASKYFLDNGGTAPGFAGNFFTYKMSKDGMVWLNALAFNNATGVSGAGAVELTSRTPLVGDPGFGNCAYSGYGGYQNTATNPFFSMGPLFTGNECQFRLNNGTLDLLTNASFPNTVGYGIYWSINYPAANS